MFPGCATNIFGLLEVAASKGLAAGLHDRARILTEEEEAALVSLSPGAGTEVRLPFGAASGS
jgi:hypothetical protein